MVMGVLNVTPDSFSDGGRYFNVMAAVERAFELEKEGAEILDIGAESTRPGAQDVSESEELRRILPVIERLKGRLRIPISIDTMKPAVARLALKAGASIVNDVNAKREDRTMWRVVAEARAGYICVHMQNNPRTMQQLPIYFNVVEEVSAFFGESMHRLNACGILDDRILLDVGIGFGKTVEHNLELLSRMSSFKAFARPLVLGISRKSFIGKLLGAALQERLPASLVCAAFAVESGVQIIRAHDVAEHVQAMRMAEAIQQTEKRLTAVTNPKQESGSNSQH
jgi:dihydropteroate synthase